MPQTTKTLEPGSATWAVRVDLKWRIERRSWSRAPAGPRLHPALGALPVDGQAAACVQQLSPTRCRSADPTPRPLIGRCGVLFTVVAVVSLVVWGVMFGTEP